MDLQHKSYEKLMTKLWKSCSSS